MFTSLFQKNGHTKKHTHSVAKNLYACALENTRQKIFYTQYAIPDSFDGRFDLLLLHIFLILNRIMDQENYKDLSQALFDITFKDMDQTLREMGIGDMGVPKHMKRMMKAFNGRMHNYQIAVAPETLVNHEIEGLTATSLENTLARNLYSVKDAQEINNPEIIKKICAFTHNNLARNGKKDITELMKGRAYFINTPPNPA